ncbi:MAG: hypothetical protein U9R75_05205, partial [Candidatus Thermoplasmatota archaeon]|nr:hypothetical protein [Candidatus Thermoplasmatota archaeon]
MTFIYIFKDGIHLNGNRISGVFLLSLLLLSMMFITGAIHEDTDGEPILSRDAPSIDPPTREEGPLGLYGGRALYDDVVLIVNDDSEISKEIGTYFARMRGLPAENIINISASTSETITPAQF